MILLYLVFYALRCMHGMRAVGHVMGLRDSTIINWSTFTKTKNPC
jgi:hypothetical protein